MRDAPHKQKRQAEPAFFVACIYYLEASAEAAAAAFLAFFDFLAFLAFGAGASMEAADAEAAAEAGAAAVWLAAKEEAANRPATRAAISFFIFDPSN